MKRKDFVPSADATFNQWQRVLIAYLVANAERLGLSAATIAALLALQTAWEAAFALAEDPATRTKPSVAAKKVARTALEKELRASVKEHITYNRSVSDADRGNMGLPVHDSKPTPAAVPTTRPEVEVKFDQQREHSLHVYDSVQSSAGKPGGTMGFEIYRTVVAPDAPQPAVEQMQLVVLALHSPHKLAYTSAEQGKRVYYAVRWMNTRGQAGPWSELASAIVA